MTKKRLVSLAMAFVMSFSIIAQAALPVMAADENLGDNGEEIVEVMDNGDETTNETENEETLQPMGVDPHGTFGNGFSWELLGNTLTIDGSGDMPDYEFLGYGDGDLIITEAPWFDYNEQIEYVVFTQDVTSVGAYAFAGYPNITMVGLHEGLKSIGESAFMLYQGTTLDLPSTLEYLGDEAFLFATNVETLRIPANLEHIGYGALSHMDSLSEITVAVDNAKYKAVDGVLYSKDGTELVLYPCGDGEENVVVPEGVSVIGNGAFWGKWTMQSVSLPSTLCEIGSGAFQVCMGLTEITIPEGVTYIGSYAFNSCDGLKTVNLPATIETIEDSAFARCPLLTTVNYAGDIDDWNSIAIGAGNEKLLDAYLGGGVATSGQCGENVYWEFENGTITITGTGPMYEDWGYTPPWLHLQNQIEHLVVEEGVTTIADFSYFDVLDADLPEGLVYIGRDAFCGFRGTSITLPSTVEIIGESAFCDAHNLTSIHLPAKVEEVDSTTFCRNYSLTQITVDINNPYIKSVNGALYTKDGTMLIVVPAGKTGTSYTVENNTEIINSNGLAYCTFENVVLPDTVTTIGTLAFRGCENLETVTIPAGITTIKSRAFRDCDNLTRVNFKGTEAQWENILANTKYDNNPLLLATTYLGDNSVYEYKNVPVTFHHDSGQITVGFYKYMPLSIGGVGGSTAPTGGGIELWFTDPQLTQEWDMDKNIITGPINLYANTYVESAPSDEFTWHYDEDASVLYINGRGDMPDYSEYEAPWYEEFQYRCANIVVCDGITSIGDYAFYNMMANTVVLPQGLTRIGCYAFSNGSGINGGINIPASVTEIGEGAFHDVTGPIYFGLDNEEYQFIDGVLYRYGNYMLAQATGTVEENLIIPNGTAQIAEGAFIYNTAIKSVTVPSTIETIYGRAFFSALSLEEVIIPAGLQEIRYSAFNNCVNLKKVVLPATVTRIDNFVFDDTHEDLVICFMGTEDQWNAITMGPENAGIEAADIVFNYEYTAPLGGQLTDTISWSLVDGVLTLSGTGIAPEFGSNTTKPWEDGDTSITKVVVGEGITSLGKNTFRNLSDVETVVLPSTLKSIGSYCFAGSALKTINLPDGLTEIGTQAFNGCRQLTDVTIPQTVTTLPDYAFYNCVKLNIRLHKGITSIGAYALKGCTNGRIEFFGTSEEWDAITKGTSAIDSSAELVFSPSRNGQLTDTISWALEAGVLTISGSGAMPDYDDWKVTPWYGYRDSVTSIVIGDGITYVGKFSFVGFNYVESLSLPEGLESIGSMAFASYKGSELILPSTLKTAGNDAFATSHNITTLHIPAAYESGVAEVFGGCAGIEEFTVDEDHPLYKTIDGVLYSKDGTVLELYPIAKGDTFTVPEGVTKLDKYAFWQSYLTGIKLPSTLKTIGEGAFFVSQLLTSIVIPEGVETIGERAFSDADSLKTVVIPTTVKNIQRSAFNSCEALETVYYGGGYNDWEQIAIGENNEYLTAADIEYYATVHGITIIQPANGTIEATHDVLISGQPVGFTANADEGYMLKSIIVTDDDGTTVYDTDYVVIDDAEGDITVTAEFVIGYMEEQPLTDTISWIYDYGALHIMGEGEMPDFGSVTEQPWYTISPFINHIEIYDGITRIGAHAFNDLDNVTFIRIPGTVESIGRFGLANMGEIDGLEMLPDVVSIGPDALRGTYADIFNLSYNMMNITSGAFAGFGARVFEIHGDITGIEDNAFADFTAETILYNGPRENWESLPIGTGNEALDAVICEDDRFGGIEDTDINWHLDGGTLNVNGNGAMPDFENVSDQPWNKITNAITDVKVEQGITYIGKNAFAGLVNLEKVNISSTVTEIGESAFAGSLVEYLILPKSVTAIGENAFDITADWAEIYYAGNRDDFYNIAIAAGNDKADYPQHINTPEDTDWVTVYFDTLCDISLEPEITVAGYNISSWALPNPERNGYVITGWYVSPKYFGSPYTWQTDLFYQDTILFAKWKKVTTTGDDMQDSGEITGFNLYTEDGIENPSAYTTFMVSEGDTVRFHIETEGYGDYYQFFNVTSSNSAVAEYNPMYNGFDYELVLKKAGTVTLTFASIANPALKKTVKLTVKKLADEIQVTLPNMVDVGGEKVSVLTVGQTFTPTIKWVGGEKWPYYQISVSDNMSYNESTGKVTVMAEGYGHVSVEAFTENGHWMDAGMEAAIYAKKTPSLQLNTTNAVVDASIMPARAGTFVPLYVTNLTEEHCEAFSISWTKADNIVVYDGEFNPVESPIISDRVYVESTNTNKSSITVTFKALDGSGKTAKAKVQTGNVVQRILVSGPVDSDVQTIGLGKSVKLTADVLPSNATNKTLKWTAYTDYRCEEISDVVSVSKDGTVKGLKTGTALIYAEATDGGWASTAIEVEVVNPANKVVMAGGAKTVPVQLHDNWMQIPFDIQVLGADGTTTDVSQQVEVTVSGSNAKYAEVYFYEADDPADESSWYLSVYRPGKYTVKATTIDGSKKSASVTIDVQQHLFSIDAAPAKGAVLTEVNGDTFCVVKAGTTITPAVTFNGGEKAFAPVAAAKKYTLDYAQSEPTDTALTPEQCFTITGTKVKMLQPGYYQFVALNTEACAQCNNLGATVNVMVIPSNGVSDLQTAAFEMKLSKGTIDLENNTALVATGVKTVFTPYINGAKLPSGVKVEWTATKQSDSSPVTISAKGELNLTGVEPGETVFVNCTMTDKQLPTNTRTETIEVEVLEKLTPADIQLVEPKGSGYQPITECEILTSTGDIYAYVLTKGTVSDKYTYSFKSSNTKVIKIVEHPDLYGMDTILEPVGVGTSTITVTSNDGSGVKQTFKVTVGKQAVPVKRITLGAKSITLAQYSEVDFWYKLDPAVAGQPVSYPAVQWTVDDADALMFIDENGDYTDQVIVNGVDELGWQTVEMVAFGSSGKATITGKALDGSGKTAKVTVNFVRNEEKAYMKELELNAAANTPHDENLGMHVVTWGKSIQFTATVVPNNVKEKNVIWEAVGLAYDEAIDDYVPVINPAGITIKNGKLTVAKPSKTVTPFEGIVMVMARGVLDNGYSAYNGPMFVCVKAPLSKLDVANATPMYPGEERLMQPAYTYNANSILADRPELYPLQWTVSDTKLATVDQNGNITVKEDAKVGKSFKVTATTQDGSGIKVTKTIKIVEYVEPQPPSSDSGM